MKQFAGYKVIQVIDVLMPFQMFMYASLAVFEHVYFSL